MYYNILIGKSLYIETYYILEGSISAWKVDI